MKQCKCRLTLADKFFGGMLGLSGGSAAQAPLINVPQSKEQAVNFGQSQINLGKRNIWSDPLLNPAAGGALNFWSQMFGPGNALATGYANTIAPEIASGGQLSPAAARDVTQATRSGFAARGQALGNQGLGAELLNRDAATQQRLSTALGQAGQVQGLESGGLNQLTGVRQAATNSLFPWAQSGTNFLGNILGLNQQTAVANAGFQQQATAQQSQNFWNWINSMASVAGGAVGASDERIKTNIRDTGAKTKEGVPYKTFEYKTRPGVLFLGHTAQDVEKKRPDAVVTDPVSGLKMIDFYKFGSRMVQLSPYGKAA